MQLRRVLLVLSILSGALPGVTKKVAAQTDYYNTDAGRPVVIEDAYPVERFAFEGQMAPLKLVRLDDGAYHWEFEPELAYGIFPGTQIEAGAHLGITDRREGDRELGLEGISLAVLHNLNVETRTLPAFAIAAEGLIPLGAFAPDGFYPSVTGIATRSFRPLRLHLNASYTIGATPDGEETTGEAARWMAGIAVDRTLPLHGVLLIADAYVEEPLAPGSEQEWTVEAGARYQLNPFFALDVGLGRRLTGDEPATFLTLGAARTFGIRSLMRVR